MIVYIGVFYLQLIGRVIIVVQLYIVLEKPNKNPDPKDRSKPKKDQGIIQSFECPQASEPFEANKSTSPPEDTIPHNCGGFFFYEVMYYNSDLSKCADSDSFVLCFSFLSTEKATIALSSNNTEPSKNGAPEK